MSGKLRSPVLHDDERFALMKVCFHVAIPNKHNYRPTNLFLEIAKPKSFVNF